MAPKTVDAAVPGEVRLYRTDLPKDKRRSVTQAANLLYKRIVEGFGGTKEENQASKKRPRLERWSDFARSLQGSLDRSLGPQWHVLIGENIGFACKKRNQTMALFRVDKIMVVCWRSPGIEEKEASPEVENVEKGTNGTSNEQEADRDPPKWRVMEPTPEALAEQEEGSELHRTLALLRRELRPGSGRSDLGEVQQVAQDLRRQLTAELGTIWHVAVGTDFVTSTAWNRRNFCRVAVGKTEVVCFQHDQFEGRRLDHEKILKALPFLLLILFCFGYMTLHSVCGEEAPSADRRFALMLRRRLCHEDWEWKIQALGAAALIMLFVSKKSDALLGKLGVKGKVD